MVENGPCSSRQVTIASARLGPTPGKSAKRGAESVARLGVRRVHPGVFGPCSDKDSEGGAPKSNQAKSAEATSRQLRSEV